MDGTRVYYAKRNWSVRERQITYDFSCVKFKIQTDEHQGREAKILKTDLPYDPAVALLGIYLRDTRVLMHRGTCTPMFIAALSTIAKLWKEDRKSVV